MAEFNGQSKGRIALCHIYVTHITERVGPLLVGLLAQERSAFFAATVVGGWAALSTAFFWLVVKETHHHPTRKSPELCCG